MFEKIDKQIGLKLSNAAISLQYKAYRLKVASLKDIARLIYSRNKDRFKKYGVDLQYVENVVNAIADKEPKKSGDVK